MKKLPKLLLISGTGRNSGKTTLACAIIEKFRSGNIIAVKISPHNHTGIQDDKPLIIKQGYVIFQERDNTSNKDSSRYLAAGATKSFYIQTRGDWVSIAFMDLLSALPEDIQVICESPALRKSIEPGIFLMTESINVISKKSSGIQAELADRVVTTETLDQTINCLYFKDNSWSLL